MGTPISRTASDTDIPLHALILMYSTALATRMSRRPPLLVESLRTIESDPKSTTTGFSPGSLIRLASSPAASRPERSKAGATLERVGDVFSHTRTSLSIPMTVISSGTGTPIRRAALGMYPVYPASCEYALGAPAFDRVVVSLPSGAKLEIASEGASAGRVFSQAVFNGRVLSRPFVKLLDLQVGGRLEMRWP